MRWRTKKNFDLVSTLFGSILSQIKSHHTQLDVDVKDLFQNENTVLLHVSSVQCPSEKQTKIKSNYSAHTQKKTKHFYWQFITLENTDNLWQPGSLYKDYKDFLLGLSNRIKGRGDQL